MAAEPRATLLTIEDEPAVREIFRNYLEDCDYRVLEATDGPEGLRKCADERPDLVLLDLRMPGMDGLEVLARLTGDHPETPVVVISGTGVLGDVVEALRLGAWDYLLKPVQGLAVLAHAVEKALERARLRAESRTHREHLEQTVHQRTAQLEHANAELNQLNTRLRQVVETTRDLSSATSRVRDLGPKLLVEFGRHMMASGGSLYMVEADGLHRAHSLDPGHAPEFLPLPLPEGSVFEQVLTTGRTVFVRALAENKSLAPGRWHGYRDGSLLAFPLPDETGRVSAVLSLHSKAGPPFLDQDREIGEILASYGSEVLRAARATEAMRENEYKYRSIFENLQDIYFETEIDGQILELSPSVARVSGYTRDELLGVPVWSLYAQAENRGVLLERLRNDRRVEDFEIDLLDADGTAVPFSITAELRPGRENTPPRVCGTMRDIRRRKTAETALRREAALNRARAAVSRTLVEESRKGLEPVARQVLARAMNLTGSTLGYIASIRLDNGSPTFMSHVSKNHPPCNTDKAISFPAHGGKPYPGLWGHGLNTGEALFTNTPAAHPSSVGVPPGHPPVNGFLCVPIRKGDELVGQVALANPAEPYGDSDLEAVERLAELMAVAIDKERGRKERDRLTAELRQAQKMEAIGTLAGGIAHDFNNILSAILGYTELAQSQLPDDHRARRSLDAVVRASDRATDLVRQILTFSRRSEQERRPLRVVPVVKEALKLLRASTPATVEFRESIAACPPVVADPTQIHQLLMNLCTNAIHAMDNRGVLEVELAPTVLEDEGDGLATGPAVGLTVRDSGRGMDTATSRRVFDPFFTTKGLGEGTGLGLSVVHGIVQAHGGRVSVESTPGVGTAFRVVLPATETLEDRPRPEVIGEVPGGDEKILLVDDEPDIVDALKQTLELLGYTVVGHTDAGAAVVVFQAAPDTYDLVITDQTMPGMTGTELARAVAATRPRTPVILCTGYTRQGAEEEALAQGIRRFVHKPVPGSTLARVVREVLDEGIVNDDP